MASIGSLVVNFQAETAAFRSDLAKAERALTSSSARMNRSIGLLNKNFSTAISGVKAFAGAFGAAFSAQLVAQTIGRTISQVARLADTAEKLGVSAEMLQRFRFAAEQSGVATNTADMALQRFVRRVGEAQAGTGELLPVLKQYNVQLRNADGTARSAAEILGDFAEVTRRAGSAQEQLRIAFKGFDSEGAVLVNLLRQGRDGMEALMGSVAVLSDEMVTEAARIDDEWNKLVTTIGVHLKGAIIGTIATMRDLFSGDDLRSGIQQQIDAVDELIADMRGPLARADAARRGELDQLNQRLETALELRRKLAALEANVRISPAPASGGGTEIALTSPRSTDAPGAPRPANFPVSAFEGQAPRNSFEENFEARRAAIMRQFELSVNAAETDMGGLSGFLADAGINAENLGDALGDALTSGIRHAENFGAALRNLFVDALGNVGGNLISGGISAGLKGIGSLLGFQHGGSFVVGGQGGIDSNLVAFRATRGELVTVTPPGGGGGGQPIQVVQNITFTTDVQSSVRAEIANAAPILAQQAVGAVADHVGRGTPVGRKISGRR